MAKSSPSGSETLSIRIKLPTLQKRGEANAVAGCFSSLALMTRTPPGIGAPKDSSFTIKLSPRQNYILI
ncbi:hypothetical protein, partial [uncultured Fretibacterium sp.]|uniref:hypothetical protein n=1 Tax=uncultured Fretibacterium sp. TaxID=1678694 RepID=UPI002614EC37